MSRRSRRAHRRSRELPPDEPIDVRVGSRRAPAQYRSLRVAGVRDTARFEALIDHTVASNPGDPILIVANGYQPWLEDVFLSCLEDLSSPMDTDRAELNREVQLQNTVRFPESAYRRTDRELPWTWIIDHMNVPAVYFWSFDERPPENENIGDVDNYRMRVGVWTCGKGAYIHDRHIPVTIVFTRRRPEGSNPTIRSDLAELSEQIVTVLLFPYLYSDPEYHYVRPSPANGAYNFLRLYNLLTDWQNIQREFEGQLDAAERNSINRNLPVKYRTRTMHRQIDRIWELLQYLRFHSRSFKKLLKIKDKVPKKEQDEDPVWDEMEDAVDDLDQSEYELDALKERFNNLTDLEFNIENASQSDDSRFLTVIATLFLPLSYLASIWGITTFTGSPRQYLYAAIPVLFVSMMFIALFPLTLRRVQKMLYPEQKTRLELVRRDYTMLGQQLNDVANAPAGQRGGKLKQGRRRVSRSRSQTRNWEKFASA